MNPLQRNLIYSWIVLLLTIIYVFIFLESNGLILLGAFLSAPLYVYFRGSIDKGLNLFKYMPEPWKKYIVSYYLLAAAIIIGKIINNPNIEPFELNGRVGFLKFMLLISTPFLLIWLKREIHMYKESGNEKT